MEIDITNSMAILYLYIIIGFFVNMLSCDLQRLLKNNVIVQHLAAFVALFFLITTVNTQNADSIVHVWSKTVIIYILFMMSTKAKLPFVIIVALLLIADLTLKTHINYLTQKGRDSHVHEYEKARTIIMYCIVAAIVVGFLHYVAYAYKDHKDDFSIFKVFIGTPACKS